MNVLDLQENWEESMDKINDHIQEKMDEFGVSKDKYYKDYGFQEFNLTTYVPRQKCDKCRNGLKCDIHAFTRDQAAKNFD